MTRRALLLALALASCHRHHAKKDPPVRWSLSAGARITRARVATKAGDLLLDTEGGRWLVRGAEERASEDIWEPLVAAADRSDRWLFAGESGAIYESKTALSSMRRVARGLSLARATAIGAKAILAVDRDGILQRSTDGGDTFAPVAVPRAGVVTSIAMTGSSGFALALPAMLMRTTDDGATWTEVPSAPIGARYLRVDGDVVLRTDNERFRLSGDALAFAATPFEPEPDHFARSAMSNGRIAHLVADEEQHVYRRVRVEVGGEAHALFDACDAIELAMHDDTIAASCDLDAGSELARSTDGGRTFIKIPTSARGRASVRASLAVGDGFLYYGPRCFEKACSRPRTLDASGAWRDADEGGDPIAWASDGETLYHLSATLEVYRWKGREPERYAKLPSEDHVLRATLGASKGIVRAALMRTADIRAYEIDAGRITLLELPPRLRELAFAGRLGLASDGEGLLETDGKRFFRVRGPRDPWLSSCDVRGCVTGDGVRLGWSGREDTDVKPMRASFARPFVCKPSGPWTELGRSQKVPDADSVDLGEARWVATLRDEHGRVDLVRAMWNGALAREQLLPPGPTGERARSRTRTYVQPQGVVAARLSYERGGGGARNPVSLDASWLRRDGKRGSITARTVGAFYVDHDPPPVGLGVSVDEMLENGPMLVWLGADGLWFHAGTTGLFHFQDDGVAQTYFGAAFDQLGAGTSVLMGPSGPRALSLSPLTLASPNEDAAMTSSPVLGERAEVAPFDDVSVRASYLGRTFVFGLDGDGRVQGARELTYDARRACAAMAGEGAFTTSVRDGERHPVIVEGGAVYATDRVRAREGCLVAWEAKPARSEAFGSGGSSVLVFADDPRRSLEIRSDGATYPPTLSTRPVACELTDVPLPPELENAPGFRAPDAR